MKKEQQPHIMEWFCPIQFLSIYTEYKQLLIRKKSKVCILKYLVS